MAKSLYTVPLQFLKQFQDTLQRTVNREQLPKDKKEFIAHLDSSDIDLLKKAGIEGIQKKLSLKKMTTNKKPDETPPTKADVEEPHSTKADVEEPRVTKVDETPPTKADVEEPRVTKVDETLPTEGDVEEPRVTKVGETPPTKADVEEPRFTKVDETLPTEEDVEEPLVKMSFQKSRVTFSIDDLKEVERIRGKPIAKEQILRGGFEFWTYLSIDEVKYLSDMNIFTKEFLTQKETPKDNHKALQNLKNLLSKKPRRKWATEESSDDEEVPQKEKSSDDEELPQKEDKRNQIDCNFGGRCIKEGCPYNHLTQPKEDRRNQIDCNFGGRCIKEDCPYKHSKLEKEIDKRKFIMCRHDTECNNEECRYKHTSVYVGKHILGIISSLMRKPHENEESLNNCADYLDRICSL